MNRSLPSECSTDFSSPKAWQSFREQFPVREKWAYFDNAAVAPLPQVTAEAVRNWLQQASCEGDTVWLDWSRRTNEVRQTAAEMIGADTSEVAFVANTTAGIGLVAEGFTWQDGDNVVTFENEFPSNLYPWMNLSDRGVETRRVPVENGIPDLDRLDEACDERTRMITVSWVGYASGYRLDVNQVSAIARKHGALFFLDAIQGLGVFPLDVHEAGVDFLAADGHKWMVAPEGAGLLYVAQPALAQLRPLGVGWNSVKQRSDYKNVALNLRDEASRYEGGSPNMMSLHALGASLDLIRGQGVGPHKSPFGERVVHLTDVASELLADAGARIVSPRVEGHKAGILVFDVPNVEPATFRNRCMESGIVLSCRGAGIRISPHAYNDEDELTRLADVVREFVA